MVEVCVKATTRVEEAFKETIEHSISKIDQVCEDLPWPLDWFCHAVTTVIKWVETVVKTIVKVWVTLVCYPLMLALTLLAETFQLLLAVPIVGTILKWGIGAIVWLGSQLIGLFEAGIGFIGIRLIKHLRVHIIVLMRDDRTLTAPLDRIGLAVQRAESIFRSRAEVKIQSYIHQVNTPSPRNALYVDTDAGLFGEDMTGAGFYYQTTITEMLWDDNPWFAIRVGAPVVVFVVDGIGTTEIGCSAGPLVDYVCVAGSQMIVSPLSRGMLVTSSTPAEPLGSGIAQASTTLAHELGHACGLMHDNFLDCTSGDATNLMYCTEPRRGDNLSPFQRAIVRSSPHVTYI